MSHCILLLAVTKLCTLAFLDGYCSTVQGLLDWFEVDLGFTKIFFSSLICVLCVFWISVVGSDEAMYTRVADWRIPLTDKGLEQVFFSYFFLFSYVADWRIPLTDKGSEQVLVVI